MSESLTPSGMFNALTQMEERISTRMELALNRVHDRIEDSNKNATELFRKIAFDQAEHDKEDAVKFARIEEKANAASGPGKAGWAGIVIAGLTGMGAAIGSYFKAKGQ